MTAAEAGSGWDLAREAETLRQQGLWRELRMVARGGAALLKRGGETKMDFSSNDYLGLAASAEVAAMLVAAVNAHGAGAGASRLVCGSFAPHAELERGLAAAKGAEAALTFGSGYAVAMGGLPALVGKGDTVILDKLSHACLVDAAKLSGATIRVYPHNHLEKLERLLGSARGRVLVVTESVFSMDGDRARLAEIVGLKERYGAWLWLDEAHGFGVVGPEGRGVVAELGLEGRVDLQMGTLSKALGLSGGYLAGSRAAMELLVNRARSFVYSTAPPPFLAAAAVEALVWMRGREGDRRRAQLEARVLQLKAALGLPGGYESAIVPIIVGSAERAVALSRRLEAEGFLIPAIRYPTVARGAARLRVTLSALHEASQVEALAVSLSRALAELGGGEAA